MEIFNLIWKIVFAVCVLWSLGLMTYYFIAKRKHKKDELKQINEENSDNQENSDH